MNSTVKYTKFRIICYKLGRGGVRGSVDGIATCYGIDGPGIEFQWG